MKDLAAFLRHGSHRCSGCSFHAFKASSFAKRTRSISSPSSPVYALIEMNPGICSTSSRMRRDVFRYASESAPSRRWVLKMTTTSVGSFTRRYGTCLRSRPVRGRDGERGAEACPLRPASPAVLRPVYEFQPGPRFIHGADLHIHEAV